MSLKQLFQSVDSPQEGMGVFARIYPTWYREAATKQLEIIKKHYEIDPNPLYAWEVYWICRQIGKRTPAWVLEYFDRAADRLIAAESDFRSGKGKGAPASVIAESLEMKRPGKSGSANVFTSRDDSHGEMLTLAVAVYRHMQPDKTGRPLASTYAIEKVSQETRVPKTTIWRAWKKAKKAFPELS